MFPWPYKFRTEENLKIMLYNNNLGFMSLEDIEKCISEEKRHGIFDIDKAFEVQFQIFFEENDETWNKQLLEGKNYLTDMEPVLYTDDVLKKNKLKDIKIIEEYSGIKHPSIK